MNGDTTYNSLIEFCAIQPLFPLAILMLIQSPISSITSTLVPECRENKLVLLLVGALFIVIVSLKIIASFFTKLWAYELCVMSSKTTALVCKKYENNLFFEEVNWFSSCNSKIKPTQSKAKICQVLVLKFSFKL